MQAKNLEVLLINGCNVLFEQRKNFVLVALQLIPLSTYTAKKLGTNYGNFHLTFVISINLSELCLAAL